MNVVFRGFGLNDCMQLGMMSPSYVLPHWFKHRARYRHFWWHRIIAPSIVRPMIFLTFYSKTCCINENSRSLKSNTNVRPLPSTFAAATAESLAGE
jgi:hypothetical protein